MGKYFKNEELDGLWARLVARVEELTGITDIFYPAGTILVENAALGWVDDSNGVGAPQPVTSASLAYPVQAGKKYLLNNVEITIPASGTYGYNNETYYFGIENNIICEGKSMGGAISGTNYYTLIAAEDVVVPHTGLRQLYRALAAFFHLNPLASWTGISSRDYAGNTIAEYFTALAAVLRSACSSDITTLETMVTALEQYSPSPEEPEEDENGFILNPDGSYTLNTIQYEAGTSRIIIPGEYNGAPVTKITATNLQGNTDIKAITIGEGVVEIDKAVFMNCNNVEELTLPQSLEKVGASAFTDLLYVTTLNISANLTSIGAGAFAGMERLTSITVDEANPIYYSKGNCLITKNPVNRTLVLGCNTSVIPQEDDIQIIGNNAFEDCKHGLIELRIPSTVHTIGSYAFDDCEGIVWMTIPARVKIQAYAFKGCTGLTNIYYEGASIDEWNQNVQIYVEKDHNSNHLLLRVKKACQGDWEWTSEGTPVITNSSAKAFLFTVVCNDDAYLDAPTENLKLGTTEFWEWWKNYFQYGIELNKRYYIDNTIFTAAVTNEGHVFAPEGTSIITADGQQYTIYDGGPSPVVRDNKYNHPNSVTFYAVTGALEQLTPLSYEVDGTQDTFVYNPNDVAVNVVYQYEDRSKSEIIDANSNSSSVLAIVDDFIRAYEENVTYSIMATISADGYETRTNALKVYCKDGTWYKGEVPTTKQLEPLVFISDFSAASAWENHNDVDVTAIMYIDGIEVARRMIEAYVSEDMVYEVAWMANPGDYVENPETGRTYTVSVIATAEGYLDSEAVTCQMYYDADSDEWHEGEAPGGGGDTETVVGVEAIVEDGVLTIRSGLPWVRWYNIHIWANGKDPADAPSIAVQSDTFAVIDHNNNNAVSIPLRNIFLQNGVARPEDGSTIHLRIEADDEMNYPFIEIDVVWKTASGDMSGSVSISESDLDAGWFNNFLVAGKAYYANDTCFIAVETGNGYAAPPHGLRITNGENTGTTYHNTSNWCVSWYNEPSDTRFIVFSETDKTFERGDLLFSCTASSGYLDDPSWREVCSNQLKPGKMYYIEDTLFTAMQSEEGYNAPPLNMIFTGTDGVTYQIGHGGPACDAYNLGTQERVDGLTVHFYKAVEQ